MSGAGHDIETLRRRLHGELLVEGDAGYESARTIWNAMIDRRPALIARCTTREDVAAAVSFARRSGLPLSVRGGGHGVAGHAVIDGGLMIDLSPMRSVTVDPGARVVRALGGATWGEVDRATQAHGLATPGGLVSSTGVAGLTLGGGIGWLSRQFGLAADNLRAAEIVTAQGEVLRASASENADLFWGLRGGSGNFGVVTTFELELHEVGPEVLFGPTFHRLEDAAELLRFYRERAAELPNECAVFVDLITAGPAPFLPADVHGKKLVALVQFFAGDLDEGERVLAPLRRYGRPIADLVARRPYVEAQSFSDALYEKGARNYWTSHNFETLTDGALDGLVETARALPTPESDILVFHLGGAINTVASDATAYPHRETRFIASPGARWRDAKQDDACVSWVRNAAARLAPHATAHTYVNFISEREGREHVAYGPNHDRLAALKEKYDPENLFRANQNVAPAAQAAGRDADRRDPSIRR